jgi:hypothetical protein
MFPAFDLAGPYPYHYKTVAMIVGIIMLAIIALPVYGIYRLIIRKMTEKTKATFHKVLSISGICIVVIFFAWVTLELITEHQVNRQLGFSYATPETPEGEFFIITKVVPGGVMDRAGLNVEDRVLMNSAPKLYRILIRNQGGEAEFKILRDKNEISIRVRVPEMELLLRRGAGNKKDR